MSSTSEIEIHLFVCTNKKEGKKNCFDSKGEEFRSYLKDRLKPLGKKVRVNKAGCLGACSKGAVAVVYPEGKWFYQMNEQSAEEIANYIEGKYQDA